VKCRFLVLVLLAGGLFVAGCLVVDSAPTNRVTVVNASGQTARAVHIEVCGKCTDLGDIPPGGSASARFGTPSGDHYIAIRGRLLDGTV
jgi:hypothetical protein